MNKHECWEQLPPAVTQHSETGRPSGLSLWQVLHTGFVELLAPKATLPLEARLLLSEFKSSDLLKKSIT